MMALRDTAASILAAVDAVPFALSSQPVAGNSKEYMFKDTVASVPAAIAVPCPSSSQPVAGSNTQCTPFRFKPCQFDSKARLIVNDDGVDNLNFTDSPKVHSGNKHRRINLAALKAPSTTPKKQSKHAGLVND
jgi:hypothetical protein